MKKVAIPFLVVCLILLGGIGWFVLLKQETPSTIGDDGENVAPVTSTSTNNSIIPTTCTGVAIKKLTEGPYYESGSPERQMIRGNDTSGTFLLLEGYVFDTSCQPIAHAWLDFWQADGLGNYDNSGFMLRGHQYTDANGKYKLITVIPGLYPGRTEHIHFKIKASERSGVITSQLFFPGGTANTNDSIFDSSLVVDMTDNQTGQGKHATYNFVVEE